MHRSKTFLTTIPQANIIDFIDNYWHFSVINNTTVILHPPNTNGIIRKMSILTTE